MASTDLLIHELYIVEFPLLDSGVAFAQAEGQKLKFQRENPLEYGGTDQDTEYEITVRALRRVVDSLKAKQSGEIKGGKASWMRSGTTVEFTARCGDGVAVELSVLEGVLKEFE